MPRAPQQHPLDRVWTRLRGPFGYPSRGHECQWERFDADRAGCLLCGKVHVCQGNMNDWRALESSRSECCPLTEADDHSHVCLITGLCFVEVRTSNDEFVDTCAFDEPVGQNASLSSRSGCPDINMIHSRVQSIISHFLRSEKTANCRKMEMGKYSQRLKHLFVRILKQRKKERPYCLPDLCSVIAEVASLEPPPQFIPFPVSNRGCLDVDQIIRKSSANIGGCIAQICSMGFKKICQGNKFHSIVIGMLYISRTGLRVDNMFYLPHIFRINELLPSETYLNYIGISNKVICDTENEIKTCIRLYSESLRESAKASARSTFASSSAQLSRQALSS